MPDKTLEKYKKEWNNLLKEKEKLDKSTLHKRVSEFHKKLSSLIYHSTTKRGKSFRPSRQALLEEVRIIKDTIEESQHKSYQELLNAIDKKLPGKTSERSKPQLTPADKLELFKQTWSHLEQKNTFDAEAQWFLKAIDKGVSFIGVKKISEHSEEKPSDAKPQKDHSKAQLKPDKALARHKQDWHDFLEQKETLDADTLSKRIRAFYQKARRLATQHLTKHSEHFKPDRKAFLEEVKAIKETIKEFRHKPHEELLKAIELQETLLDAERPSEHSKEKYSELQTQLKEEDSKLQQSDVVEQEHVLPTDRLQKLIELGKDRFSRFNLPENIVIDSIAANGPLTIEAIETIFQNNFIPFNKQKIKQIVDSLPLVETDGTYNLPSEFEGYEPSGWKNFELYTPEHLILEKLDWWGRVTNISIYKFINIKLPEDLEGIPDFLCKGKYASTQIVEEYHLSDLLNFNDKEESSLGKSFDQAKNKIYGKLIDKYGRLQFIRFMGTDYDGKLKAKKFFSKNALPPISIKEQLQLQKSGKILKVEAVKLPTDESVISTKESTPQSIYVVAAQLEGPYSLKFKQSVIEVIRDSSLQTPQQLVAALNKLKNFNIALNDKSDLAQDDTDTPEQLQETSKNCPATLDDVVTFLKNNSEFIGINDQTNHYYLKVKVIPGSPKTHVPILDENSVKTLQEELSQTDQVGNYTNRLTLENGGAFHYTSSSEFIGYSPALPYDAPKDTCMPDQNPWKIHVSIANFKDIPSALKALSTVLVEKYDVSFKILKRKTFKAWNSPENPEQNGKIFTIYPRDIESMQAMIPEIEQALAKAKILPGLIPQSDLCVGDYCYVRDGYDKVGNYIEAQEMLSLKESNKNLKTYVAEGKPDPFEKMGLSYRESKQLMPTAKSLKASYDSTDTQNPSSDSNSEPQNSANQDLQSEPSHALEKDVEKLTRSKYAKVMTDPAKRVDQHNKLVQKLRDIQRRHGLSEKQFKKLYELVTGPNPNKKIIKEILTGKAVKELEKKSDPTAVQLRQAKTLAQKTNQTLKEIASSQARLAEFRQKKLGVAYDIEQTYYDEQRHKLDALMVQQNESQDILLKGQTPESMPTLPQKKGDFIYPPLVTVQQTKAALFKAHQQKNLNAKAKQAVFKLKAKTMMNKFYHQAQVQNNAMAQKASVYAMANQGQSSSTSGGNTNITPRLPVAPTTNHGSSYSEGRGASSVSNNRGNSLPPVNRQSPVPTKGNTPSSGYQGFTSPVNANTVRVANGYLAVKFLYDVGKNLYVHADPTSTETERGQASKNLVVAGGSLWAFTKFAKKCPKPAGVVAVVLTGWDIGSWIGDQWDAKYAEDGDLFCALVNMGVGSHFVSPDSYGEKRIWDFEKTDSGNWRVAAVPFEQTIPGLEQKIAHMKDYNEHLAQIVTLQEETIGLLEKHIEKVSAIRQHYKKETARLKHANNLLSQIVKEKQVVIGKLQKIITFYHQKDQEQQQKLNLIAHDLAQYSKFANDYKQWAHTYHQKVMDTKHKVTSLQKGMKKLSNMIEHSKDGFKELTDLNNEMKECVKLLQTKPVALNEKQSKAHQDLLTRFEAQHALQKQPSLSSVPTKLEKNNTKSWWGKISSYTTMNDR